MKRFFAALALASLLSVSVLAGEIPTLGTPQPPPQGISDSTSPGEIPTLGLSEQLSKATVSVLLTVLGLLSV
jgi:hypothetical protein